jgi:hypothetical protein
MKTAARVLGIAGGIAAIVIGLIFFFTPAVQVEHKDAEEGVYYWDSYNIGDFSINISESDLAEPAGAPFSSVLRLIMFGAYAAGGVLGLTGGLLAGGKNAAAGALMLVGTALSVGTVIAPALLMLGGIFALIPGREPDLLTALTPGGNKSGAGSAR